jgi:hypothetical protein
MAGTPQGSVLSPVLANIYLHYILDLWFERVIKSRLNGYAQLIRYADDFIIGFQSECEAKQFTDRLRVRLVKFGLRLAEAKSRIIEFGRYRWQRACRAGKRLATFDFLGITHYCDYSRAGGFKVGRRTARTRLRRSLQAMNAWLKLIRNQGKVLQWWPQLAARLRGYYNYYAIGGNMRWVSIYYYRVRGLVFRWLNERSQERSYTVAGLRPNPIRPAQGLIEVSAKAGLHRPGGRIAEFFRSPRTRRTFDAGTRCLGRNRKLRAGCGSGETALCCSGEPNSVSPAAPARPCQAAKADGLRL